MRSWMQSCKRASEVSTSPDSNRRPEKEGRSKKEGGAHFQATAESAALFPLRRSCGPPALLRRSWVTQQGWLVCTGFESGQLLHTKWSSPPPFPEPVSRASAQKPPARTGLTPLSISAFSRENGSCSRPATPKTWSSVKEGAHQCCEGKQSRREHTSAVRGSRQAHC